MTWLWKKADFNPASNCLSIYFQNGSFDIKNGFYKKRQYPNYLISFVARYLSEAMQKG